MKKRLMIVAFMVLALIFTAGCGSEKNEEAELETKSAGYHIMNRRSSNMTREDGFCETFTSYINGKTFEKGDRLSEPFSRTGIYKDVWNPGIETGLCNDFGRRT